MPITKASSSAVAPGAKGDLVVGNATNDSGILTVGANGTVLTADSAEATGVKWAAAGGGGMTVIASGTLSGAETSITSIPSTYVNLFLVINNPYLSSGTAKLQMRINASSAANYGRWFMQSSGSNGGDGASQTTWKLNDATVDNLQSGSTNYTSASVWLWNYANTTSQKSMSFQIQDRNDSYASLGGTGGNGGQNTVAISSVQILAGIGSFAGGTYTLYGVK